MCWVWIFFKRISIEVSRWMKAHSWLLHNGGGGPHSPKSTAFLFGREDKLATSLQSFPSKLCTESHGILPLGIEGWFSDSSLSFILCAASQLSKGKICNLRLQFKTICDTCQIILCMNKRLFCSYLCCWYSKRLVSIWLWYDTCSLFK